MIKRLPVLSGQNSFFLFGARGTGKSTLIESRYRSPETLWIDLLLSSDEERFAGNPDELLFILNKKPWKRVVTDEIQKVPKLLDVIQKIMRCKPEIQFIMSGSSARKLKRGAGNLLAGRAFQYYLFPFSVFELEEKAAEEEAFHSLLEYGSLPLSVQADADQTKREFLKSYTQTYLKEEIVSEQIVRKLSPFRNFLRVAAQQSGQIINHSNIARDTGADDKTVKNYFSVLEDTLLGFSLPCYSRSVRKQQIKSPKFYFFDTGVKRALEGCLNIPLAESGYAYGNIFEHRVITECFFLNEYMRTDFHFSYLRSKDQSELDLIVERPGKPDLLIEIKSARKAIEKQTNTLRRFQKDWPGPCKTELWSQDKTAKTIGSTDCLFWKDALRSLFFPEK